MNGYDLLQAMEHINEGLIEEAYNHKRSSKSARWRVAVSFAASVACILFIFAVCLLPQQWTSSQKANSGLGSGTYERDNGVLPMAAIREIDEIKQAQTEEELTEEQEKKLEKACNKVLEKYGVSVLYPTEEAVAGCYNVISEDGSILYKYCQYIGYNAGEKTWKFQPNLVENYLQEYYAMGGVGENRSLEEYLQDTREYGTAFDEKIVAVQELLEEDEYLSISTGMSYDYDSVNGTQEVFVTLAQGTVDTEALEELGVKYYTANVTVEEVNEHIRKLWERREELGICDISVMCSEDSVGIKVYTDLIEEKVRELLTEDEMQNVTLFRTGLLNSDIYLSYAKGIEDLDEFMAYIEEYDKHWMPENTENEKKVQERQEAYAEYAKNLRKALESLKEAYPDYSYLQLYYHVAADTDYECYLGFDEELEVFVDSLDIYTEEKYFIDELEWGDAECIELKRMLSQYKEQYPELSYEELYEKCGYKAFLENDPTASNYERLMWSLYQKQEFKDAFSEKTDVRMIIIAAVCVVFLVVVLAVLLVKRKKHSGKK